MSTPQPVSAAPKLVTAARILPAARDRFVEWSGRVDRALQAAPGYSGREIIPPQPGELDQWVFVTHFDTQQNMHAWRNSAARARLFEEAKPLLEGGAITELEGSAAAQYHVENSVTEVILEQVKPGKEEAYREWSNRIQLAQAKLPGYQGGYTKPPSPGATGWMTLMRFATVADLDRWMNSPERTALIREGNALVEKAFLHRVDTSFPGWAPTDPATGQNPPNWKTTMLVLLGLYPIVSLEIAYLMAHLSALRPAFASFIGNAISVALTGYITMPWLVRWLGWWLFPKPENATKITLGGTALISAIFAIEIVIFWNIL
jgi:uncharacterized protein